MRNTARSGLIRSLALALALIGATLFGAPRSAEAAPAIVSTEIAGPATALTEVQYGRHHGGRRFHHHHRGRHFGHHHRRHFGHHFGRRHGHHHGHRRYRY